MSENIDIKLFSGKAMEIAKKLDKSNNSNNFLDGKEISLFLEECVRNDIHIENEIWFKSIKDKKIDKDDWETIAQKYNGKSIINCITVQNAFKSIKFYIKRNKVQSDNKNSNNVKQLTSANVEMSASLSDKKVQNSKSLSSVNIKSYSTADIDTMIFKEAKKRNKTLSPDDLAYWSKKISNVSTTYNVPPALLVSIIGKETNFCKNEKKGGPMQVTQIAVADFFPTSGNRYEYYKKMNGKLLDDILYTKDAKGNKVLKYKTPTELRKACSKDDELGIKVGLLCFEVKYVEAVAAKKKKSISQTINGLKSGNINLGPSQNKDCVREALKNYNTVFKSYAGNVVDSLENVHKLDFGKLKLIPTENSKNLLAKSK